MFMTSLVCTLFQDVKGKAMREFGPRKQGGSINLLILNKGATASLSLFMPFSSNRRCPIAPHLLSELTTPPKKVRCCFAPPSGRNRQGHFQSILVDVPSFSVNFSRLFPRFHSISVGFIRCQSILVNFSQF